MARRAPTLVFLLALTLLAAVPARALHAQRVGVDIALPAAPASEGPTVRSVGLLRDSRTRDLLLNGFPVRLHYRVELWTTGGWFNDLVSQREWDVVVRYDPLAKSYGVARIDGDQAQPIGRFTELADAEGAVERPARVPLAPRHGERQYYTAVLEVETLSLSDLDEVESWLRGELKPAVRGRRNPGTALTRGVRTLLVKLLGGEKRQYETRSGTFRA